MRVIVAGSRDINDYVFVSGCILVNPHYNAITEIVEGGAKGVDSCARRFAEEYGIKHTQFNADWMKHGLAAGPRRNREMAAYAASEGGGILIAIPSGKSKGTRDMIRQAELADLLVYTYEYPG